MSTQFKAGDIVTLDGYEGAFKLKEGCSIVYPLYFEIRGNHHSFTKEGREDVDQDYPVLKLVREQEKPYSPSRRDYFAAQVARGFNIQASSIVARVDELIAELDRSEK